MLTYSAYVAEVFRAGIESVHPSQVAAARSLGLTHGQSLRHVVLPQAVRNVIPPLLNDLVSLSKDSGLISILGAIDAVRAAQIETAKYAQLHALRRRRDPVRAPHLSAHPLHRRPRPSIGMDRRAEHDRRQRSPEVSPAGQSLLSIRGVRKSFGDHLVLDDLSLDVDAHRVVVLIGASGSGKSTLLRCIDLLEDIDDGVIELEGRDITDPRLDANAVRARIGMVFQAYNLFPHLRVLDNVTLAPRLVHKAARKDAEDEAMAVLDRVGLAGKAQAYPDELQRWPAAARGDRPGPRRQARRDAARRGDQRARPGARRRGPLAPGGAQGAPG